MVMEKTWRWYGPNDPVTLNYIKQTGATGIVNALHEVAIGEVWTPEAIAERKKMIEDAGMIWSVIESIPVHEDIKLGKPNRDEWLEKYKESVRNAGAAGIKTVCYNFMPVLDWTRTNLAKRMDDGAIALEFEIVDVAAFDVHMLKRNNAEADYTPDVLDAAKAKFKAMTQEDKDTLQNNIIAGLPGGQEGYSLDKFLEKLETYKDITPDKYRENFAYFLKAVIPVAEEAGVKLAVHPDDPPFTLFGLPRIVSTEADLEFMFSVIDSIYNGYTMCTGSFGVRGDNDLAGMVRRHGDKLNFVHLRSVNRHKDHCFFEDQHLAGSVDMFDVIKAVLEEQKKREASGRTDVQIPMRPDHGHVILDDINKKTNPGYSAIGRLKGLAELRGMEMAILKGGLV